MKVEIDLGIRRWFSRCHIFICDCVIECMSFCLSTNQWTVHGMYVEFVRQGRCHACTNMLVIVVVVVVVIIISLSSRSEHWLNNFRLLMNDVDYLSSSSASLTTRRSWSNYVLSLLFSFSLSFSFSCRSSFFYFVFLHLITIAVFIHSLELLPRRPCRNIKTSSSSLLSSSVFSWPLKKKYIRENLPTIKVSSILPFERLRVGQMV